MSEFFSDYFDGEILNPDEILAEIPEALAPEIPIPEEPEDPTEKRGVIGAFCRVYTIDEALDEFLPDIYVPCTRGDNYRTYIAGTSACGLYIFPSRLYAFSHHDSDPANTGHAINAFDLVRIHKFGQLDKKTKPDTPLMKLPSFKAMREMAVEIPEIREEIKKAEKDKAASDYDEVETSATVLGNETYQTIVSELLKQIKWVDFREKAELREDATIPRKTYVTIAVDELLETAVSNNWGLCTKNGFIYVYNGSYWQVMDAEDFKQFLARAAIKMGVPVLDAKYHLFKDEIYKQFLSEANLPTPENRQNTLINLINGTFEISENGQSLREPRREDFIKYQLPFEYNPDANCPMFDAFLDQVQPDEACRAVLAEYIGYVFVRGLKLEKLLMLYGSGANGKSVFFDIVRALLGEENVCSYSLSDLTRPDSWQRAELGNNLLNYTTELGVKLENSIFKQLVSGEPVGAQRKYQDPFTMTDYARLMVNSNGLPRATELTHAFFRRFLIVPFNVTIPEKQQNPELAKEIISNELSGVFNWVLGGLKRILANKRFTESRVIQEQIDTYRKESDSVALFMDDEGYTTSTEKDVPLKELYEEYVSYCYDNGYHKVANREMRKRLKNAGYCSKKGNTGVIIYAEKK
ncbi:DNA primase family protein [Bacteroides nordii]|uniref:DNA primase family protein n=1 Tax=Bacteroides nordii TaxID=291645 RepID=UPI003F7C418F